MQAYKAVASLLAKYDVSDSHFLSCRLHAYFRLDGTRESRRRAQNIWWIMVCSARGTSCSSLGTSMTNAGRLFPYLERLQFAFT